MLVFVEAFQAFMDRVAALGVCFLVVLAIVLILIMRWFRARSMRKLERRNAAKRVAVPERIGPSGM